MTRSSIAADLVRDAARGVQGGTAVRLPEELLRQADEVAGQQGRSAYIAETVAQRVKAGGPVLGY